MVMKQFCNHGWKYLEQMEDIVPLNGANGVWSSYRRTTSIPSAVSGPDTPGSVISVTGDVPPVASARSATANILLFLPAPLPASPITAVGSNSNKCPYSIMSPNVTNPSDSSLLFSPLVHLPSSISRQFPRLLWVKTPASMAKHQLLWRTINDPMLLLSTW